MLFIDGVWYGGGVTRVDCGKIDILFDDGGPELAVPLIENGAPNKELRLEAKRGAAAAAPAGRKTRRDNRSPTGLELYPSSFKPNEFGEYRCGYPGCVRVFNSVAAMHTHIGWHKRAENIAAGKYDVSNSNGCPSHLSTRSLTQPLLLRHGRACAFRQEDPSDDAAAAGPGPP